MKLHLLIATAAVLAFALSGCTALTGLPEGSADLGDTVTVRYSVTAPDGSQVRAPRTATFVLGSGASGLGADYERSLRGHAAGANVTFATPSVTTVEVDRELQGIPQVQDAPKSDYEANVGPAFVGQTFPAFGIYTATVTAVDATTVSFTIDAVPGQRDPVASVGAYLVSDPDGTTIHRTLEPNVGQTFTVNQPQFGGSTPLGLAPGQYRTAGATATKIQYDFAFAGDFNLTEDLTVHTSIVRITPIDHTVEPECDEKDKDDCNYVVRPSPYVNGDPASVVLEDESAEADDGHAH